MSTVNFEIVDIKSFRVDIFFKEIEFDTLHKELKLIERGEFISGKIESDSITKFTEKNYPSLQLTGNGFQIQVYPDSIRLFIASQPVEGMFVTPSFHSSDPPKKLFATENLQKLNLDYNTTVGRILGTLNIDYAETKGVVAIHLEKRNADYETNNFSKDVAPIIQSILGEPTEIQSTNVTFKTKEVLCDANVYTYYDLSRRGSIVDDTINAVTFEGRIRFKNTGAQDLNMILTEYLKRINYVTKKLVGGLILNE